MSASAHISVEMLRQLIAYDPASGKLTWKPRPEVMFSGRYPSWRLAKSWNARHAGQEALTAPSHGYRVGNVLGRIIPAHVAAWCISHGEWPSGEIDHIDGNRSNNRAANLRVVSHCENGRNIKRPVNNTSGQVGVSWAKDRRKWRAYIGDGSSRVCIGHFSDLNVAIAERKMAERSLGYHPNHGRAA